MFIFWLRQGLDLTIDVGAGGQSTAPGAGSPRRPQRVVNPYLDSGGPTARGIRQMHGRLPSIVMGDASSVVEERRGQPKPTPGASNKIQVQHDLETALEIVVFFLASICMAARAA